MPIDKPEDENAENANTKKVEAAATAPAVTSTITSEPPPSAATHQQSIPDTPLPEPTVAETLPASPAIEQPESKPTPSPATTDLQSEKEETATVENPTTVATNQQSQQEQQRQEQQKTQTLLGQEHLTRNDTIKQQLDERDAIQQQYKEQTEALRNKMAIEASEKQLKTLLTKFSEDEKHGVLPNQQEVDKAYDLHIKYTNLTMKEGVADDKDQKKFIRESGITINEQKNKIIAYRKECLSIITEDMCQLFGVKRDLKDGTQDAVVLNNKAIEKKHAALQQLFPLDAEGKNLNTDGLSPEDKLLFETAYNRIERIYATLTSLHTQYAPKTTGSEQKELEATVPKQTFSHVHAAETNRSRLELMLVQTDADALFDRKSFSSKDAEKIYQDKKELIKIYADELIPAHENDAQLVKDVESKILRAKHEALKPTVTTSQTIETKTTPQTQPATEPTPTKPVTLTIVENNPESVTPLHEQVENDITRETTFTVNNKNEAVEYVVARATQSRDSFDVKNDNGQRVTINPAALEKKEKSIFEHILDALNKLWKEDSPNLKQTDPPLSQSPMRELPNTCKKPNTTTDQYKAAVGELNQNHKAEPSHTVDKPNEPNKPTPGAS